jgi:glycosyltransferase involved in cell wall biosynthesis
MTVHDFKLISPDYTLWATKHKPSGKSIIAKLFMGLEYYFHKTINVYKKNIDLFIAPSEFVKNKLIEDGFEANKIIVLPHFTKIERKKITSEKNYIVYFGRLDKSKGINTLIKAFAKIESDTKLKIIGSGPEEQELKELTKKLNCENKIEFISHCKKDELELIIADSMFSVFPSLVHETFGLGIIESYALGKPVIASSVGAFTENVKNNTGILFDTDNEKQLEKALEKLISDKNLRISMGENALKVANEKFTNNYHYDKIINIYSSLVTKK